MKVGIFVPGEFHPIDIQMEQLLLSGQVYEVRTKTTSMDLEAQSQAIAGLMGFDFLGVKVIGVETSKNSVRLQLLTSPTLVAQPISLFWGAFLPFLIEFITPLGIILIGIILAVKIPNWALAVPFVALGGAILIYALVKGKK